MTTPTIFDIETNGIDDFRTLDSLETIHCLVMRQGDNSYAYTGDDIECGLELLANADIIVGHNILAFDIPAIQKLYPGWKPGGMVRDTIVMARLAFPDQKDKDFHIEGFPKQLIGRQSLESWGHRLGEYKGDYTGGWDELNDDMLEYCKQDVLVNQRLWNYLEEQDISNDAVVLEHAFAECLIQQERNGFHFDTLKAANLWGELSAERDKLRDQLVEAFPPVVETMKTPAFWEAGGNKYRTKKEAVDAGNKAASVTKGPMKTKLHPFNPDSRQQIARCLIEKYGWEPEAYTPNGQPQVDESILKSMPHEEAKLLVLYLTLSKRIGQLSEGKEAWMKLEQGGKIHGRVNHNGTVTGRCTHSKPNVAQVPACYAPYGKECRELFYAPDGRSLVGVDASGLELRCLAHYLSKWDGGLYGEIIVDGDIHTANQKAAGLETRDKAKTFIYAFLYGSGPVRLGKLVGGGAKEGKILMNRFLKKMPALQHLKTGIDNTLEKRNYLVGLDGRHIPVRSKHSALNALLQCAGAVIMKQATVQAQKLHRMAGIEAKQVAHIHDEVQYTTPTQYAERVGELTVKAIRQAGGPFDFQCPLDGEFKAGQNWAETH